MRSEREREKARKISVGWSKRGIKEREKERRKIYKKCVYIKRNIQAEVITGDDYGIKMSREELLESRDFPFPLILK